ncbi:MarR family transcriptional regulator [Clostridium sp. D2Q-11]|uniref:MarR family transcriptional regulator n=1 Tax=Anaeromonas frigoriresistens TaxID=2683708 RepID=A0A942Z7V1_9FIRM|nr:MarR family transcriptional regulator [Anaeromonas frigoriresistens]
MLSKEGVTRVQWIALYYLGNDEEFSQRDLADVMNIKESTIARLIDRMEREELVIRKRNEKDRRIMNLVLTEKGKAKRKELLPKGEEFNDIVSKGIPEKDMKIFMSVLDKMVSNVKEHRPQE